MGALGIVLLFISTRERYQTLGPRAREREVAALLAELLQFQALRLLLRGVGSCLFLSTDYLAEVVSQKGDDSVGEDV
ncbi:hypothetical protein PG985_013206 [Apiospora marii]|uniref:Uncharacterized protein n=1 Tax=Apiospora marii TaxID=335849 RepID=A0ABR1RAD4_9PEZI